MSDVKEIATRFVDLALKHERWDGITELPADEVRLLLDVVTAAGFEPKEVVPGKAVSSYLDEDGHPTGKIFPINSLCPFKVVNQEGSDHGDATGWLNLVFGYVVKGGLFDGRRDRGIEYVAAEIERAVPLEPIQLTSHGDRLCERPPNRAGLGRLYIVEHKRDSHEFSDSVGVHQHCNGRLKRRRATTAYDVIVCEGCFLRVRIPIQIKTFGKLRQFMEAQDWAVTA